MLNPVLNSPVLLSILLWTDCDDCQKLRILRAASTHFPLLGSLLRLAYTAVRSHTHVFDMEKLCLLVTSVR